MVKIEMDIFMENLGGNETEVEIIRFTKADGAVIELKRAAESGRIQIDGEETFEGTDYEAENEFEAIVGFHPSRIDALWE